MVGKITKAYIQFHGIVSAENYGFGIPLCPDNRCRIQLDFVQGHQRAHIVVLPYFRKHAGNSHRENCHYNDDTRLQRIVRFSVGFTGAETISFDMDGKAVFDVDILKSSLNHMKNSTLPNEIQASGNKTISGARVLTQTLRTANAVVGLISRMENEKDLKKIIKIKCGKTAVHWSDFFYMFDEIERLFKKLKNGKQFPVAVAVRPLAVHTPVHGTDYLVRCRAEEIGDKSDRIKMSPSLWISDERIVNKLKVGKDYLVIGIPQLDARIKNGYRNINLQISSQHQLCRFDPVVTREG